MKIIHTADIHFTNKPEILEDLRRCTAFLLEIAYTEVPELIIIAGDLFDERIPLDSPAAIAAIDWVKRLARVSPILLLKGNNTHDRDSLSVFTGIEREGRIYVADHIHTVALHCTSGELALTPINKAGSQNSLAIIRCLPALDKGNILASLEVQSVIDGNIQANHSIRDLLAYWGAIRPDLPMIVAAHGTVFGSATSSDFRMRYFDDPGFTTDDLRQANADLYCLGHIHKPQSWNNIFYSGSLVRMDFSEVEEKGFWIHEIGETESHRFIKTPTRTLVTIDLGLVKDVLPEIKPDGIEGSYVRVRYKVNEEDLHKVDEGEIRQALSKAADVKIEKEIIPKIRQRAEGISKIVSIEDKIRVWGKAIGQDIPNSVLTKVKMLYE